MKKSRHEAIIALINKENIGTQEELMIKLNDLGYKVTQATVSRDIKSLKLIKTPISNGQYKYSAAGTETENFTKKYFSILSNSATSINCAGNIAVIKCYSGMAQAACAAVDSLGIEYIVGTIAGDDTIFVLCKDDSTASELKDYLEKILRSNEG